jgi:hypothetical protein
MDFFFTTDSMVHGRSGRIELLDLGEASRVQGVANQSMQAFGRILTPVTYTISVLIVPTLAEYTGDVDASISYNFLVNIPGSQGTIRGSGVMDLTDSSAPREFVFSGEFYPSTTPGIFTVSADSVLSAVIDGPGESIMAAYTMSMRLEFYQIPAPSVIGTLGMVGLFTLRRRRT